LIFLPDVDRIIRQIGSILARVKGR